MEIRVDFSGREEWSSWNQTYANRFDAWRHRILTSVEAYGFTEPVTTTAAPAKDILFNPRNYRESLSYNGMNSRKRGLLLEFDTLRRQYPRFSARNVRIFSPEALSRTSLILRGIYPFFLGAEYIPDESRWADFYPIEHADMTSLDIPENVFDIVITSDVLEFVPDLYRSLQEISRIMRPGGALIATIPFAFNNAETVVVPRTKAAESDPVQAQSTEDGSSDPEGTAEVQVPGWDVLDMCREAGLRDARMTLHASSSHGVLADAVPGVFVLSAMKTGDETRRPRRSWLWDAARINRVVGVLGLPRSGTTMFAAVLDAHEDVTSVYEPWNARKNDIAAGKLEITANSLLAEAEAQDSVARTMVIKETTTAPSYPRSLARILDQAQPPLSRHLLILLRNPLHSFLSQIDGRRKWWGEASLELTQEVFVAWARRTLDSFTELLELVDKYNGAFVFYEACVADAEETFGKVMREIGLSFHAGQLQITKNSDLTRIRGDQSLVENARDVGDASVSKRDTELEATQATFSMAPMFGTINDVCELFRRYTPMGVIGAEDPARGEFITELRGLLGRARG